MKIFIIDDDHLCTFLTHTMLGMEDGTHDVRTFHSATDALDALISGGHELVPDIIFLDLNMPVMDGWEFLDVLTQLDPKFNSRCRIYILTSSLDLSDTKRVKEYPIVSDLIYKPIKSEEIRHILAHHAFSN